MQSARSPNDNSFRQDHEQKNHVTHYSTTKPTQYILKEQQVNNPLQFKKIQKDMKRLMDALIQEKLKQRNTIILAKLAKQTLITCQSQVIKPNKKAQQNSLTFMQDPLISKSIDQINQYFCSQISTKIIKRIVNFLKKFSISAKIMATGIIIENAQFGFNLGGICFWNNNSDGQITIKRTIPPIQCHNHNQISFNQREGMLVVTVYICKFEKRFRGK